MSNLAIRTHCLRSRDISQRLGNYFYKCFYRYLTLFYKSTVNPTRLVCDTQRVNFGLPTSKWLEAYIVSKISVGLWFLRGLKYVDDNAQNYDKFELKWNKVVVLHYKVLQSCICTWPKANTCTYKWTCITHSSNLFHLMSYYLSYFRY